MLSHVRQVAGDCFADIGIGFIVRRTARRAFGERRTISDEGIVLFLDNYVNHLYSPVEREGIEPPTFSAWVADLQSAGFATSLPLRRLNGAIQMALRKLFLSALAPRIVVLPLCTAGPTGFEPAPPE